MLTFYPSRIPESKRHRIPDPQHWKNSAKIFEIPHLHREVCEAFLEGVGPGGGPASKEFSSSTSMSSCSVEPHSCSRALAREAWCPKAEI
jgi:hypothetical protein